MAFFDSDSLTFAQLQAALGGKRGDDFGGDFWRIDADGGHYFLLTDAHGSRQVPFDHQTEVDLGYYSAHGELLKLARISCADAALAICQRASGLYKQQKKGSKR